MPGFSIAHRSIGGHTLGAFAEVYFTSSHLPLASEKIHVSLAACLAFCSSSTYLQHLDLTSVGGAISNRRYWVYCLRALRGVEGELSLTL